MNFWDKLSLTPSNISGYLDVPYHVFPLYQFSVVAWQSHAKWPPDLCCPLRPFSGGRNLWCEAKLFLLYHARI